MSEVERFPNGTTVLPITGEVINLRDPAACVKALNELGELDRLFRQARRLLTDTLAQHSLTEARRTVTLPGGQRYTREGGPESRVEYRDPALLKRKLLAAGMPAARVDEIVVETVDRKVNGTQANAAAKANPAYAAIIAEHRVATDQPWKISVR